MSEETASHAHAPLLCPPLHSSRALAFLYPRLHRCGEKNLRIKKKKKKKLQVFEKAIFFRTKFNVSG